MALQILTVGEKNIMQHFQCRLIEGDLTISTYVLFSQ